MSRVVTFGEIMARLATPGHKRFGQAMPGTLEATFAGAEASVAGSIAYLGGEAAFVTALPDHAIADACVAGLRSLGVDTRHILRTPQGRLGLYFLETGATTVSSSEIVGSNSTQYVKAIATVAKEGYGANLTQGQPVTATGVAGVRTITYNN